MLHGTEIVTKAQEYTGVPYVWGGNTDKGWDCSGFVLFILRRLDVPMAKQDTNAHGIWCLVSKGGIEIEQARAIPGCLVFRRKKSGLMEHVGFSDGQNHTIEARGKDYGTGSWAWRPNWTHAALVPGVFYGDMMRRNT